VIEGWEVCPWCGLAPVRRNGRDRRVQRVFRCKGCGCAFTQLSGTPFADYRFPPEVIALAVR
jgi:transposase-like protein